MLTPADVSFLHQCRALVGGSCRVLVTPELEAAGVPLYTLFASEFPSLFAGSTVQGYCGTHADVGARGLLQAPGLWRGRGPTICVNDVAILAAEREWFNPPQTIREAIFETALHETAHAICDGIRARPEPATFDCREELAIPSTGAPASAIGKMYSASVHAGDFHRAVIHLAVRARALTGYNLSINAAASCEHRFGFSPATQYADALAAELLDVDTPVSQFLPRPFPPEFEAIVARDMARFMDSLQADGAAA